jgi:serine/threonine protein kinase
MSPASPALPVPTARQGPWYLGRYELIGELARGGMGTVYLARHAGEAGFQRLFAVKALHPHLADEKEFVDMLRDEARIAARIHHPNVVSVIDLGVQGGVHYVVMEYVEGPSFGTLLRRNREKECPPDLIVSIIIDSLEGLHAAHTLRNDEGDEQLLVHRDVSPQNILVGTDGAGRITDFGIAKAETRITSTRPGTRKGKLLFMSPEQITGSGNIDRRTDIWATAAVLWGALTGKALFKGENDAATMHNVLTKEVPPPSTEGLKPPAAYDAIILRALERDPAKRYDTAYEMAEALRTAAANEMLGIKHRVARWVAESFSEELDGRRKAIREVAARGAERPADNEGSAVNWLAPLPAIASTASVSSDVSGTQASQARDQSLSQLPDFNKPNLRLWIALGVVALLAIVAIIVGSRDRKSPNAPAAHDTPAASVAGSASAVEKPRASPEQLTPVEALPEATHEEPAAKQPWRPIAPRPTFVGRPTTKTEPEANDPTKEASKGEPQGTAPKPKPTALPPPTSAPVDDFEKNPYLRR